MDETARAAGGPDPAAVEEAIRLFGAMRNSLQRWHDAYRRVNGGPASDPSRGQGRVLALLEMHGEMRQRDMGRALDIRPQSLGEVLAKLERAGLVKRRTSDKDRRVLLVSITEQGSACVRRHKPPFPAIGFTSEELSTFSNLLSRAVDAFDEDTARLNAMAPQDDGPSAAQAPEPAR